MYKRWIYILICIVSLLLMVKGCEGGGSDCGMCGGSGYYEQKTCPACGGSGSSDFDPYEEVYGTKN